MSELDVIVGVVGRARGLSGEVFVDLRTDSPVQRFAKGAVLWVGESRALTVRSFHRQGVRGLVRFAGVDDRTAAETLAGTELTARVSPDESTGEPDVFFDHQLVGLAVVSVDGSALGTVTRVDHGGYQDMLVVAAAAGERLVPFVDDLVPEVRVAAGQVIVRPIPGLLEDEL